MNPETFKQKMYEIRDAEHNDVETKHIDADEIMCEVLIELGYGEGITIFQKMKKWYS
jgi:hypothetical protein